MMKIRTVTDLIVQVKLDPESGLFSGSSKCGHKKALSTRFSYNKIIFMLENGTGTDNVRYSRFENFLP